MATQIQVRRDTSSNWTSANPTLANGEIGFETNTGKAKIGNGSTAWNSLSYNITGTAGTVTSITAGTGLSGGTITSSGTIAIDTATTVDLSTSQTLTNKNLTSGTNTFPSTLTTASNSQTFTNKTYDTAGTGNSFSINGTAITANTGTGSNVLATSPTIITPIITQPQATPSFTANAYTLVAGDAGQLLLASNGATAGTINIPTDATTNFAIGTQITILQTGAGQITVQATTSGTTTLRSTAATSTAPKCRVQYSAMTLWKQAANLWYAFGDIS